jgi:hypothetical protein
MAGAPVVMSSSAAAADNPILAENQQPGSFAWFRQGPSGDDATGRDQDAF